MEGKFELNRRAHREYDRNRLRIQPVDATVEEIVRRGVS